jgi:hypothetical protein
MLHRLQHILGALATLMIKINKYIGTGQDYGEKVKDAEVVVMYRY